MKKQHILFVCTGNTCRSAMTEALFNKMITNNLELMEYYTCSSAGVYAFEGDEASGPAIEVMKEEYDIDLKNHRAKVLSYDHIKNADLVLTMTMAHREMVLEVYPEAADKTFSLKEFANFPQHDWDIQDPYGGSLEVYKLCAKEIFSVLEVLEDKL